MRVSPVPNSIAQASPHRSLLLPINLHQLHRVDSAQCVESCQPLAILALSHHLCSASRALPALHCTTPSRRPRRATLRSTPTTTPAPTKIDARFSPINAPAYVVTSNVDHANRCKTTFNINNDDNDEALGWESCGSSETPPRRITMFQVYMTNPGEPSKNSVDKGKAIDPKNQSAPVIIGKKSEAASATTPTITLSAPAKTVTLGVPGSALHQQRTTSSLYLISRLWYGC